MIPIARRTMGRKGREKIEGEDSIVHDEREKAWNVMAPIQLK